MQVLYGHLFYTSSIVMAGWWFAIIPLLIIGYYAAYNVALRYDAGLRPAAALLVVLVLGFVGFMFVNNNTMALVPAQWTAWFAHRDGSVLNLSEPTLLPPSLRAAGAPSRPVAGARRPTPVHAITDGTRCTG